jgi:hypothetical protein
MGRIIGSVFRSNAHLHCVRSVTGPCGVNGPRLGPRRRAKISHHRLRPRRPRSQRHVHRSMIIRRLSEREDRKVARNKNVLCWSARAGIALWWDSQSGVSAYRISSCRHHLPQSWPACLYSVFLSAINEVVAQPGLILVRYAQPRQLEDPQLDMRQAQGRRKPASIILVIRVTSDVGRVTASSFQCARAAC